MITEEEIKKWLREIKPYLCSCTNQYHLEHVIENIAHELYTKLFTAPSDLREKLGTKLRDFCHFAVEDGKCDNFNHCETSKFCYYVLETLEAIHSLYVQAGFKSPEEVEQARQEGGIEGRNHAEETIYSFWGNEIEQAKKEEREKIARVLNEGLESTRKPSQWQGTVVDYEQWGKDCVYPIMLKLEQGQALKEE